MPLCGYEDILMARILVLQARSRDGAAPLTRYLLPEVPLAGGSWGCMSGFSARLYVQCMREGRL